MTGETLGDRLKLFREKAGLNPYRLGKLSGLDPGYIARIESGAIKKPGLPILRTLAKGLQISLYKLIGDEETGETPSTGTEPREDKFIELKRALNKFGLKELGFIGEVMQVPVRGYVRAGTPNVVDQEESESLVISKNLVKALTNKPEDVYGLRISGESLCGDGIHTGDIIFVLQTRDFDVDREASIS